MPADYVFPKTDSIVACRVRSNGRLVSYMEFEWTGEERRIVREWVKEAIGNHGFVALEFGYCVACSAAATEINNVICSEVPMKEAGKGHTVRRYFQTEVIKHGQA